MHREVRFTPELEDHVAGQRLWAGQALGKPVMKLFVALLVAVELAALGKTAYDLAVGIPLSISLNDNAVALLCPLLILGMTFWNRRRIPAQVQRIAEQQPTLLSETEWRWNDVELVAQSVAGTSRIEWRSLYKWLANAETIVLLPQERMLLILPRRVLTAEQADDLIATIERFAVRARHS